MGGRSRLRRPGRVGTPWGFSNREKGANGLVQHSKDRLRAKRIGMLLLTAKEAVDGGLSINCQKQLQTGKRGGVWDLIRKKKGQGYKKGGTAHEIKKGSARQGKYRVSASSQQQPKEGKIGDKPRGRRGVPGGEGSEPGPPGLRR